MRKKKVLIHSNFCKMFTGFGKHKKNLLSYLYKTGKYEIIELSNGFTWSNEAIKKVPWDSYGSLPDDPEVHALIAQDEARKNAAAYGAEMIDHAIATLKPDIYLGVEDIWAFTPFFNKSWWNKINCIVHTTLDSLPILPLAVEAAPKIKNYFVWSSFAEKALHSLGHKHVKTVRGIVETESFFKLPDDKRKELKKTFGLTDNFIIGFVFRNQLRKSVPNLLDGFKIFLQQNPQSKAKLLLHTHWSEGWDIPRLLNEKNIDFNCVLTTYFCKNCSSYIVKPFSGQHIQCDRCKCKNSCETTNITNGVNESQLNEIYNLMDVYCHPFTSGGQEIPIQEAKLTELITLVTNYSCGEDFCTDESGGLPLSWAEYREPGTQFIKASTNPTSIFEQIDKVYKMSVEERNLIGKKARQYVLNHFSTEIVGKFFENLFDSMPFIDISYKEEEKECNVFFEPNESLPDKEWIESLYSNILNKIDEQGVHYWISRLKTDLNRKDLLAYFRKVAFEENQNRSIKKNLEEIKNSNDSKRIAFIMPEYNEEVVASLSVLQSIKNQYPDHNIYFFTKPDYFNLVDANPIIHKTLPYFPKLNDPLFLEGKADGYKYFDIVFAPFLSLNHFGKNSQNKIAFNLYDFN